MAWFVSGVAVETDCPNCDLIERHPLDVVRRAKAVRCHGCGYLYTADPSFGQGRPGAPGPTALWPGAFERDRPAAAGTLVLRIPARSTPNPRDAPAAERQRRAFA